MLTVFKRSNTSLDTSDQVPTCEFSAKTKRFPVMMPVIVKPLTIIILNFRRGLSTFVLSRFIVLAGRENQSCATFRARSADFCARRHKPRFSHRALHARSSVAGTASRLTSPRLQLIASIFNFSRVINRAIPHYVILRWWASLGLPASIKIEHASR